MQVGGYMLFSVENQGTEIVPYQKINMELMQEMQEIQERQFQIITGIAVVVFTIIPLLWCCQKKQDRKIEVVEKESSQLKQECSEQGNKIEELKEALKKKPDGDKKGVSSEDSGWWATGKSAVAKVAQHAYLIIGILNLFKGGGGVAQQPQQMRTISALSIHRK